MEVEATNPVVVWSLVRGGALGVELAQQLAAVEKKKKTTAKGKTQGVRNEVLVGLCGEKRR